MIGLTGTGELDAADGRREEPDSPGGARLRRSPRQPAGSSRGATALGCPPPRHGARRPCSCSGGD